MEIAFFLVALVASVLAVTAFAGRLRWSAPLALVVAGIIGSYLPGVPTIELPHEVVLLGLLPPLLYAAALQTSLTDLNALRRPILLMSVGLVLFTTAGVAVVVHALIDGLPWAAAFAIGAVVAPPDAVAATAIGRAIGLPRRLVTLLEGESLLNDATALVALRTSIAALAGGVSLAQVGTDFVIAAGGGVAVGLLVFLLVATIRKHLSDAVLDTAVSLVTPFAAYIGAEQIHASGVIAVVVAGMLLGHKAPILQSAQARVAEKTNWKTIAFVLENTVFLLIGLQARWIIDEAFADPLGAQRIGLVCGATLVAVIALRFAWVFPVRMLVIRPVDRDGAPIPYRYTTMLSWAGMRGVVTLAAAFLIPENVPHREVLMLIAFTVVAGTLLIHGTTLPLLARVLRVEGPDREADRTARRLLLNEAADASRVVLDAIPDHQDVCNDIRRRLEQRAMILQAPFGPDDVESTSRTAAEIRLRMIDAERMRVLEVRKDGTVPSHVVREVLGILDVEESMLAAALRN